MLDCLVVGNPQGSVADPCSCLNDMHILWPLGARPVSETPCRHPLPQSNLVATGLSPPKLRCQSSDCRECTITHGHDRSFVSEKDPAQPRSCSCAATLPQRSFEVPLQQLCPQCHQRNSCVVSTPGMGGESAGQVWVPEAKQVTYCFMSSAPLLLW